MRVSEILRDLSVTGLKTKFYKSFTKNLHKSLPGIYTTLRKFDIVRPVGKYPCDADFPAAVYRRPAFRSACGLSFAPE